MSVLGRIRRWAGLFGVAGALLVQASSVLASEATLVADAHVNSALPSTNSGAISNLNVGGGYTALLQFDLSTLPAGTTASQVTRATLRLYCNRVNTAGTISLQSVAAPWGEYSVTYATMPSLGGTPQTLSVNQAGAFVVVDITALVQGWIATPASNQGLALSSSTAAVQFDSKENDLTGHAAELDVALASAGTVGATGATGPAGPAGVIGPAGPQGVQGPAGAQGAIGPAGPQGLQGIQGLQGPQGVAGLSFQGQYTALTSYALHDLVTYQGSSYISLTAGNLANTPGVTPQWTVLAQAGVNGTSGSGGGTTIVNGVNYRGAYVAATTYAVDDVVTYQGSSFISLIAPNLGNTPASGSTQWGVLALGATGQQGPIGATGPAGPQGPTGATGSQGPAGNAGAAGSPGLVYRGTYSSVVNYAMGDVVLWQGSSYASLVSNNSGNTPSASPFEWGVLTQQGPAGPAGPQGIQGLPGPQGLTGSTGPPGDTGPQGAQGVSGQAGAQGLTGPQGPTGATGLTGAQGPAGPAGMTFRGLYSSTTNYALGDGVTFGQSGYVSLAANNTGNTPSQSPAQWGLFATGVAGATGATGATGPEGPAGAAGPQGPVGPTGPQGSAGPQGPAVANYLGTYASSTNYTLHDAVNFQGSTYVSLVTGNLGNTPSLSPTDWGLLAAQGLQGLQGVAGPTGATGPVGPAGAMGPAGPTGATGGSGPSGLQGLQGLTGPQGPVGPAGPAGSVGVTYLGVWSSNTAYASNAVVTYQGASYLATAGSTGAEPDLSPTVWTVLAEGGVAGPSGPSGAAASITIGSVTTGAAGTNVSVTNSGTSSAAILNFTIPQGAEGSGSTGSGGEGTSGIPFVSRYHQVNYNATFLSVNSPDASLTEDAASLTWVPNGCTASQLYVFSQQAQTITVTLRMGLPSSMTSTSLACSPVVSGQSCNVTGSVTVPAGDFVDLQVGGAGGTVAGVWTALVCN